MSLFARTLHRQLVSAGYDRLELVKLVTELLDRIVSGADDAPLSGLLDSETLLANAETAVDALGHEMRRARDRRYPLLIVLVDVELPDWCTDEVAWAFHGQVAERLRRGVRPGDVVARLSVARYLLVLAGAHPSHSRSIIARLIEPLLAPRRREDAPPDGTRFTVRILVDDGSLDDAAALLARCAAQPGTSPQDDLPGARPAEPRSTQDPKEHGYFLALGGGAARAAAHVGVLRALVEAKVPIAGIAGTSGGALVGAMFASGMSPDAILERFVAFPRSEAYRRMRRGFAHYRRASKAGTSAPHRYLHGGVPLLSSTSLAPLDDASVTEFIEFFLGPDREIDTLGTPFAAAATDLVAGRPVWIARGPLHFAVRASCSLPGLFPPQREGDRVLVDGSVLAEVPVAAARAIGAGAPILAVHLERPERPATEFASSLELVLRASAMTHKALVREQLRGSTPLTAHVEEIGWLDFTGATHTARIGELAARDFLANLER
jgi:NTE family protein